jgi:1,4-alpha-glucan branching enzyme
VRRKTSHTPLALVAALAAALSLASAATAGVRVVEDEVFFTLQAPGAREVYLVGDFNNWNATMEKMRRAGDHFEISLFLLEGSYR